jgi:hypothetical protein
MTTNHLMARKEATQIMSGTLNLFQTMGNRQRMSIICQTLSQTYYPVTNPEHNDFMLLHIY